MTSPPPSTYIGHLSRIRRHNVLGSENADVETVNAGEHYKVGMIFSTVEKVLAEKSTFEVVFSVTAQRAAYEAVSYTHLTLPTNREV